jgi:hypothetical protein
MYAPRRNRTCLEPRLFKGCCYDVTRPFWQGRSPREGSVGRHFLKGNGYGPARDAKYSHGHLTAGV